MAAFNQKHEKLDVIKKQRRAEKGTNEVVSMGLACGCEYGIDSSKLSIVGIDSPN